MEGKTKELLDWYVSKFDINDGTPLLWQPHRLMELLTQRSGRLKASTPYKLGGSPWKTIDKITRWRRRAADLHRAFGTLESQGDVFFLTPPIRFEKGNGIK